MEQIVLPKASLAMEEAELIQWLRNDGEEVREEEAVCEVETDKGVFEIPAPQAGVLRITARKGTIKVGEVLGYILRPGEEVPEFGPQAHPAPGARDEGPPGVETLAVSRTVSAAGTSEFTAPAASPAARNRARELGVDLTAIAGTGPGGRIRLSDVEREASASAAPGPAASERVRKAIAVQVAATWRDVPHINIGGELPADGLVAAFEKARSGLSKVTYTDLLMLALVGAFFDVPELNGIWQDGFVPGKGVHIGFAVATDAGVLVPVIRDAHLLDLDSVSRERARLAEAARSGTLRVNDTLGGTATLSNLGAYPVDFFTPVINSPQVCLVATGRIQPKPISIGAEIVSRPMIWANVAMDHRAADGVAGGRLLQALASRFQSLPDAVR